MRGRHFIVENAKDFAPGIWFGRDKRRLYPDFAQSGDRFDSAGNNHRSFERGGDLLASVGAFDGREKRTRASPCEKDDQIEFSGEEILGELQGFEGFERNFADGRRHSRRASVRGDEFADLFSVTAFERQHAQTIEASVGHGLLTLLPSSLQKITAPDAGEFTLTPSPFPEAHRLKSAA